MSKFSVKTFSAAATNYLEGRKAAWLRDIIGSPVEPFAIEYAKREWILPNEDLSSVNLNDLFPNADVDNRAARVASGDTTELAAKKAVAEAVVDGLREANAAVERLRWGVQEPIPATLAGEKEHEQGSPSPAPQIASCGPAKGIPEAVASTVERVHRVNFGGFHCYTLDKEVMETIRAAQIQKITLSVETVPGDFGARITKTTVTNP